MTKYEKFLDLIVYQIYPRSFFDGNGDGIGDIKGITQKIDHLKELGVNAVWLSPCYKSPNCDNGYDISDYCDIMDEFGTMDDWKEMIKKMHEKGIKLIMDFVGNHTSSEHKWFKEGRKSKDSPYHDYYIWRKKPMDNIKNFFSEDSWEYNEATDEYYLHCFAKGQPDLNWENEKVREEMRKIIDFWVDLGVDGFRCDVIACISKDLEKGIIAEGPHMHEYIKELFGREKLKDIFTVGECSLGEDKICDLCGEDRKELSCSFQFDHMDLGRDGDKYKKKGFSYDEIRDIIVRWQYFAEKKGLLYTLLTDNHDQPRFISRLGNDDRYLHECATMYAAMFYLLKGVPFIYQGQEYGAPNPYYTDLECFDDIECVNYYLEKKGKVDEKELIERVNYGSRDNARRPFCWDNGKNFGFSEGDKTWLPLHTRGAEINLENDKNGKDSRISVFEFYKKILKFRSENNAIRHGIFKDLTQGNGYFAYTMTDENSSFLIVCNFDKGQNINSLPECEYLFRNYPNSNLCRNNSSDMHADEAQISDNLPANRYYSPFECAVYKIK